MDTYTSANFVTDKMMRWQDSRIHFTFIDLATGLKVSTYTQLEIALWYSAGLNLTDSGLPLYEVLALILAKDKAH